ncbi:NAD(P)H-dependent glycerol-3-phosphate dehydrogenase [Thermotoga sp. KOL6]|uniref:NAD(P)H-dependent glycerol-3-phosphate dehydrogenase n=1 Tax=Thermotoga sp. KOL6 TaxID=126741 RepID=UPI000C77BFB0|nr:NAD(P)H-dependent glycerol-3-phosphate dehydrogenase [Thermotoga sp. KOL6]PLV59123.1 glycerol-3-phosphate dehydrogenase [Thermotoga sp. KOL6]
MRFFVLGAGSWGTVFAQMLKDNGENVILWARRKEVADYINSSHTSPYTEGMKVSVEATNKLNNLSSSDILVIALPVQHVREILLKLPRKPKMVLNLSKGIEINTGKRISEIVKDTLNCPYAVLSGPSHAEEVARKLPTAVTLAGANAKELQKRISNDYFRVYTCTDVVGVEIAGALKNVIAIAAGILDGLGGWDNAKAALETRGIYEIAKFGIHFGAKQTTFMGLAGIGDLMVTCNSRYSRNRRFGELIAKGFEPLKLLESSHQVVEGAFTVKAVLKIAKELKLEMPISEEVYHIVYERKSPIQSMRDLMRRSLKDEF